MKFFKKNKILVLGLIILSLLLFKNPLSENNIISNLEPSPDAIFYLNPIKNLLWGRGLVISYQDRILPVPVPPLYTFTLMPFYLPTADIRSFYFTNCLLTLLSAILFYKIVTKLFVSRVLSSLLYLAYVTNFIIFFYPSFAMAENLLIPLFLLSIWLILKPLSLKSSIILAFLTVAFFGTKYVAWILSLALILIVILKKSKFLPIFLLSLLLFFALYAYLEFLTKGINIFKMIGSSILGLAVFIPFAQTAIPATGGGYFASDHFAGNLIRLLAGIMGGPVSVAGSDFIILPVIVGMTAIPALLFNLIISKARLLSLYFFLTIVGTIYYISYFVVVDARYLFEFIPAFLIIFGLFLDSIFSFLTKIHRRIYIYLLMIFIYLATFLSVIPPAFYQLKINFLGKEKSDNYQAIMVMNSYTALNPSRVVIISVLSPYQIDFFSNKKYDLLPLSRFQYFTDTADKVWGIDLKNDLMDIYKKRLSGQTVLVSNYLTGPRSFYKYDFDMIKNNFDLLEVAEGCHHQCSLYQLQNFSSPEK